VIATHNNQLAKTSRERIQPSCLKGFPVAGARRCERAALIFQHNFQALRSDDGILSRHVARREDHGVPFLRHVALAYLNEDNRHRLGIGLRGGLINKVVLYSLEASGGK
jgi:hypothetical protein